MRDRHQEFIDRGAEIVVVGMGTADKAARFRKTRSIPFRLLVDGSKKSYEAAGLKRGGLSEIIGPRVWMRGLKNLARGLGVAIPQEDPYQLGGTAVMQPDGRCTHHHVAEDSADNAPIESLLEAL